METEQEQEMLPQEVGLKKQVREQQEKIGRLEEIVSWQGEIIRCQEEELGRYDPPHYPTADMSFTDPNTGWIVTSPDANAV